MNTSKEKITNFEKEIRDVINKYSIENISNTSDSLLAKFVVKCLAIFNEMINKREKEYGRENCLSNYGRIDEAR